MADIEVEDAAEIGGAAGGAASAGKRFEVKKWNAVRARFAWRLSRGASRSCMHACSSALVRTLRPRRSRSAASPGGWRVAARAAAAPDFPPQAEAGAAPAGAVPARLGKLAGAHFFHAPHLL